MANHAQQYCTFTVESFFFGVPVDKVQEVVRHQKLTCVPLATPEIRGLMNLRGQIVTAIDLRRRLGLPDGPADRDPMHVLLKTGEGAVSLLVDQIEDVLEIEHGTIEPPPETLRDTARELIHGASKQKNRLVLLLNTEKAGEFSTRYRGKE